MRKKHLNKTHKYQYLIAIIFILVTISIFVFTLLLQSSSIIVDDSKMIEIINKLDVYAFFSTIAVILGTAIACVEIYENKKINEAEYIKDLNQQFIENKEMVEIEHMLEVYFNTTCMDKNAKKELIIDLNTLNSNRQKLVNYLVYLEGVASIIEHGLLQIKDINNLFGYRYFLAVNNPIIQNLELYPFSDYYRGIFNIYDKWIEACKNKRNDIYMQIPLYDYRLNTNKHFGLNITIRNANKNDDMDTIARILYQTDDNIYPIAFGKNENVAIKTLSELIKNDNGLLSYKNIMILLSKQKVSNKYVDKIHAVILYHDELETDTWNDDDIKKYIENNNKENLSNFNNVSKSYFSRYNSINNKNTIDIIALAVDKEYRHKNNSKEQYYYGYFLLNKLSNNFYNKKLVLEVLSNNIAARNLYEKSLLFYQVGDEYDGYSLTDVKPKVIKMERLPLFNEKQK